jgi:hypothetical protein
LIVVTATCQSTSPFFELFLPPPSDNREWAVIRLIRRDRLSCRS